MTQVSRLKALPTHRGETAAYENEVYLFRDDVTPWHAQFFSPTTSESRESRPRVMFEVASLEIQQFVSHRVYVSLSPMVTVPTNARKPPSLRVRTS